MTRRELTITSEDDGQFLPFSAFATVARKSVAMLIGLDVELSEDHKPSARWGIVGCSMSSPMSMTLQANPVGDREACDMIGPFLDDWNRLERGERPRYLPPHLQKVAKEIVGVLGRGLRSISYASNGAKADPTQRVAAHVDELLGIAPGPYTVMTELEGRIESISIHGRSPDFCIYDPLTQHAIKCIFQDSDLDSVADLIKERARVRVLGKAKYNNKHRPVSIEVQGFKALPEQDKLSQIADLHKANIDITEGVDSVDFVRGLRDAS